MIAAGIRKVVYAYCDPNPRVAGAGIAQLEAAGICCQHVPLEEINAFYASYTFWQEQQLPTVTAKLAISLDAKIAGPNGVPLAITGDALQQYTHQLRHTRDAILTSFNTVTADNPAYTVRIDETVKKPVYLLDSNAAYALERQLTQTAKSLTLFHAETVSLEQTAHLRDAGIRCVPVPLNKGRLCLNTVLQHIGRDGVHDLLVEAGGRCFEAFVSENLVQKAIVYIAPKTLGADALNAFSGADPVDLFQGAASTEWKQVGSDMVCTYYFNREVA